MGNRPGSGRAGKRNVPIGRQSAQVDYHNLKRAGLVIPATGNAVAGGMINPYNSDGRRVTDGLLSIWWFTEGTGSTIYDRAGLSTETNLTIISGTEWKQDSTYNNRYYLELSGGGHLQKTGANELYNAMQAKIAAGLINEFTIEAWVKPSNTTQDGPARIMALVDPGNGTQSANFMLGQGSWSTNPPSTVFNTRVRVEPSSIDADGTDYATPGGTATTNLQHLVYTVSGEAADIRSRVYVDGVEVMDQPISYYQGTHGKNFLQYWNNGYNLNIGNIVDSDGDDRPWAGGIYLMSMYSKALSLGEVITNYTAGVTTDSVLSTPSGVMDTPLTSSGYAGMGNLECNFTVGGYRSASITTSYSVSSAEGLVEDVDYEVVTDKTLNIGSKENGSTITIKPLELCSKDGTIDVTLTSMSTGSIASPATHTYSVSSLLSSVEVNFPTQTTSISPLSYTHPVSFSLDRLSLERLDVCCIGSSGVGNVGRYYLVDTSTGALQPLDGASVAEGVVVSKTTGLGSNTVFSVSADGMTGFVPGDTISISAIGVDGSLNGPGFHSIGSTSTLSATVSDPIDNSKPSMLNTGINALGWTIGQLKSPLGQPWYDSNGYISQDGALIVGYNFSLPELPRQYIEIRADDVTLSGCYVKSNAKSAIVGKNNVITNTADHIPSGIKMFYCEVTSDMSDTTNTEKLINRGDWDTIHRCSIYHAYSDCIVTNAADYPGLTKNDVVCQITNNYIAWAGGDQRACCADNSCDCAHGDGIQFGGSTSGMIVVSGNTVRQPSNRLLMSDDWWGPRICNCYSKPTPTGRPYTSNQCIRLIANKANNSGPPGRHLGHAYICDNWVNGGYTTIIAGAKDQWDIVGDITVSGNIHGRDFLGSPYIQAAGPVDGTATYIPGTWEDDGTKVEKDPNAPPGQRQWSAYSRYRCVNETGFCPNSTWNCDPNDPCTCLSTCDS